MFVVKMQESTVGALRNPLDHLNYVQNEVFQIFFETTLKVCGMERYIKHIFDFGPKVYFG